MKTNRIIIAGSRCVPEQSHELKEQVFRILSLLPFKDMEIVSGTCKGADKFGEWFANLFNIPIKKFPADWNTHGKKAGFLRNKEMSEYGTHLIAIWDGESNGTRSMIELAKNKGLKVRIIKYETK